MKTAIIHVIGRTQKVGYRTRVIGYAHSLNVNGYVRNLPDGRVEIVAQAPEDMLKMFINNINIQDPLIHIDDIKTKYSDEFEGFTDFHKIVGPNETDERLDSAVDQLKILIKSTNNMNETLKETNQSIQIMNENMNKNHIELVNKMDQTNENMNKNHIELVNKMDHNHVELVSEIHGLREDNSEKVMSEIQEVKALLKVHLKQS